MGKLKWLSFDLLLSKLALYTQSSHINTVCGGWTCRSESSVTEKVEGRTARAKIWLCMSVMTAVTNSSLSQNDLNSHN